MKNPLQVSQLFHLEARGGGGAGAWKFRQSPSLHIHIFQCPTLKDDLFRHTPPPLKKYMCVALKKPQFLTKKAVWSFLYL